MPATTARGAIRAVDRARLLRQVKCFIEKPSAAALLPAKAGGGVKSTQGRLRKPGGSLPFNENTQFVVVRAREESLVWLMISVSVAPTIKRAADARRARRGSWRAI